MNPYFMFPNIATPTEPIKKIGLAFEAIFNNLKNSSLEIYPSS